MKNPLFVLPKIKCGGCGRLQLSQVCKECRAKNEAIIQGEQTTLDDFDLGVNVFHWVSMDSFKKNRTRYTSTILRLKKHVHTLIHMLEGQEIGRDSRN